MMAAVTEPASPEARRRGPGRPWKPGESGNPSGFSRDVSAELAECRRLALRIAPHALARLAGMLNSGDDRVVVAAAVAILDRAGLKPYSVEPERIEVTTTVDVERLRADLLRRLTALAVPAGEAVLEAEAQPALPGAAPLEAAASGAPPAQGSALPSGDGRLQAEGQCG